MEPRLYARPLCSSVSTRMWANVQRDGRRAEYRWRPLFNAAKFGSRPCSARVPCSNAANRRAQDLEDAKLFLHLQNSVTGQQPPKVYRPL